MEEHSDGAQFADFKNSLTELAELHSQILTIVKLILKPKFSFEVEKFETFEITCSLIVDLEDSTKLVNKLFQASHYHATLFESNFKKLNTILINPLKFIRDSKKEITLFTEDPIHNFAHLKSLIDILAKLNAILEKILNSPELNSILGIKCSEFNIDLASAGSITNENLNHYQFFAKWFDLNDESFIETLRIIKDPVRRVFYNETFIVPTDVKPYAAIVGPSFMGKTQFSFVLARILPVFYFNFSLDNKQQDIYKNFKPFSLELKKILSIDKDELESLNIVENIGNIILDDSEEPNNKMHYESAFIFANSDVKLLTIGFIWSLIEYSLEFNFDDPSASWFDYYLKSRSKSYTSKSLNDFYSLMKDLVNRNQNFKLPVVFIDELPRDEMIYIRLLRNIVRCLPLPCVLSSTNANVNNMLNLESDSSQADDDVWVNVIRHLFKSNLPGIMNRIDFRDLNKKLCDYVDISNNMKLLANEENQIILLTDLNIECDDLNRRKLIKVWIMLVKQSETCLQGASYYAFTNFIDLLNEFCGKRLDALIFWNRFCTKMHNKFRIRKPKSMNKGRFFSLRMFSTNQKFCFEASNDDIIAKSEKIKEKENIVRKSIDQHFYYFGDINDTKVLPFDYEDGFLHLNKDRWFLRSHFMPFDKDIFTCISLWYSLPGQNASIATIVRDYKSSLEGILANENALSNDFCAQEVMAYWAIANGSHRRFDGKVEGIQFFQSVVNNLQLNVKSETTKIFPRIDNLKLPSGLETFINSLTIPYLTPEKPSKEFKDSLAGLLSLGVCYRCANGVGMDIGFEVFRGNTRCRAYAECKYRNDAQGAEEIKKYILNAKMKNSVLTFFVTYSIKDDLKRGLNLDLTGAGVRDSTSTPSLATIKNYCESGVDQDDPDYKPAEDFMIEIAKKKLKTEFKISVYSIYYADDGINLVTVPIYEVENPDGVFIVVQTNFKVDGV